MIRWLNSTLRDDFTPAATSIATRPTSQPKLELQEVMEYVMWCCWGHLCSRLVPANIALPIRPSGSSGLWLMATKGCCSGTIQQRHVFFMCLCTWAWLPNKTLVPWSYHKNSWGTEVNPPSHQENHSHWLNPCDGQALPNTGQLLWLAQNAVLCAAAATLAGDVLCCQMWVSSDMFNLHKVLGKDVIWSTLGFWNRHVGEDHRPCTTARHRKIEACHWSSFITITAGLSLLTYFHSSIIMIYNYFDNDSGDLR